MVLLKLLPAADDNENRRGWECPRSEGKVKIRSFRTFFGVGEGTGGAAGSDLNFSPRKSSEGHLGSDLSDVSYFAELINVRWCLANSVLGKEGHISAVKDDGCWVLFHNKHQDYNVVLGIEKQFNYLGIASL